jgi:hypothetical protein
MSSYGRSRNQPDAADGIAPIRGLYYNIISIGPIVLAAGVFVSLRAKAAQCLLKVWQSTTRIRLPVITRTRILRAESWRSGLTTVGFKLKLLFEGKEDDRILLDDCEIRR